MLVAEDVCGTEWKRQQVYASVTSMPTHGHTLDEKVPIVEIKPFTKEKSEWCRARSLPEFYERVDTSDANGTKRPESKDSKGLSDCFTPRSPAYTSKMPSPRTAFLADRADSQQSTSFLFPPKTGLAKELSMIGGRVTAWSDITPFPTPRAGVSFLATPREREFYTNEDLRNGIPNKCDMQFGTSVSNPEIHYSPNPFLRVDGYNFGPGKYFQLNARNYSLYKAYTAHMEKKESQREKEYIYRRMISDSMKNPADVYKLDTNRNILSPFFNVKHAQRKRNKSRMGTANQRHSQCPSSQGYRIGSVKNSLEILGEMGKPMKIEKQLSDDLNSTLSQIRKNNYTCFTPAPPPSLVSHSHFRISNSMPTQGEIMLAEARYANSISTRRSAPRPITQTSNYTHKTSKTANRVPSPRASVITASQYKSELQDSGIQSPAEGQHLPQRNDLLHQELQSKLSTLETRDKANRKQRAGSAPAAVQENVSVRIHSAKSEDDSQTSHTRHSKYFPSRGGSPVKEATFLHPETPSLVIQTPVIPEESSDTET